MSYIQGSGSGGGPRIYPADSSDILVWELQEAIAAETIVNTGTASSANLALAPSSGITFDYAGPFGRAAANASNYPASFGAAAVDIPITAMTLSIWVKWYAISGLYTTLLAKGTTTTSWANPYVSAYIGVRGDTDVYCASVACGGNRAYANGPAPSTIDGWTFIGMTCNTTTLKLYINGRLTTTTTLPSEPQQATGYWMVGGSHSDAFGAEGAAAYFRSARVANVVRDAAWFKAVYAYGIGEAV